MPDHPARFVDFRAVKAAVNMPQVLDHYGLRHQFKGTGDSLSGPCPIHHGSNPTQFRISLAKNCWNCFGDCHGGGNVLDFVARMENLSVREAALRLNEWFNLGATTTRATNHNLRPSAPAAAAAPAPAPPSTETTTQPAASVPTEESGPNSPLGFALQNLDPGHPYLTERGLQPETIAEFGLGYCARGSMAGRIAIPIHNAEGQLVAYAGRWPGTPPEERPKYKFPTGFRKSAELFNLHRSLAHSSDQPWIVVEGFFDAIRLWQLGVAKVVALMGSLLSPAQEELLLRHTTSRCRLLLMFDEDDAGRFGREQMLLRLGYRRFVRIHRFDEEDRQPEHLSAEQVAELLA